jgi:Tol biopolymer transport system component
MAALAVGVMALGSVAVVAPPASSAPADTTERDSVRKDGDRVVEGNELSVEPSIAANGRFVAFTSSANNLVPGDDNNANDVFVYDRTAGTTTLVSVRDPAARPATTSSAGSANTGDSLLGTLLTPSAPPPGPTSPTPAASTSPAPTAPPPLGDVDLVDGSAFGVSVTSALGVGVVSPTPSAAGSAHEPEDGYGPVSPVGPVNVLDVVTARLLDARTQGSGVAGENHLGSATSSARAGALNVLGALSADAVSSTCTSDGDGSRGSTNLLNASAAGKPLVDAPAANLHVDVPGLASLTLNEQIVSNVPGDTNITVNGLHLTTLPTPAGAVLDVIVAQSRCRAVGPQGPGGDRPGNGPSSEPSISADGRYVAFTSKATDLVGPSGQARRVPSYAGEGNVFVRDLKDRTTRLASGLELGTELHAPGGRHPAISGNGRYVAFSAPGPPILVGGTPFSGGAWDVFVWEEGGSPFANRMSSQGRNAFGNGDSGRDHRAAVSDDGRFVAFESEATNLVDGDSNGKTDIFVRDRDPDGDGVLDRYPYEEANVRAKTTRVSVLTEGGQLAGASVEPSISGDGRLVAFASTGSPDGRSELACSDIFVRDRNPDGNRVLDEIGAGKGVTTRITESTTADASGCQHLPSLSADGQWVAWERRVERVTRSTPSPTTSSPAYPSSSSPTTSFTSTSRPALAARSVGAAIVEPSTTVPTSCCGTVLTAEVSIDVTSQVFARAVAGGAVEQVSVDSGRRLADRSSVGPTVSASGRAIGFSSVATNLVAQDRNDRSDVFVRERPPALSLTPSPLDFGNVAPGTATSLTVTAKNTGAVPLTFAGVTIGGANAAEFTKGADTCAATLARDKTCTVAVSFTPSGVGPKAAELAFSDDAADSPQRVPLAGTGAEARPEIDPGAVDFGTQPVGQTSSAQPVTVTNRGSVPLTVSSVALGGAHAGDFAKPADTCSGKTVLPNASCAVELTFTPPQPGERTGTLVFADNAPGSPRTVNLKGRGVVAGVGITPAPVDFGAQPVLSTSRQVVTATNTGELPLAIDRVAVVGASGTDFAKATDDCSGSVLAAKGDVCTVTVTFTPSQVGAGADELLVADNAPGGLQRVPLTGTGVAPPSPALSINPPRADFGSLKPSDSKTMTVTATSVGDAPITISTVSLGGPGARDFALAKKDDRCSGKRLPRGRTCTVVVKFTAPKGGTRGGDLVFTDDARDNPQRVPLAASTPVPGRPAIDVSPATAATGSVVIVTGSGFRPKAEVTLQWSRGLGQQTVTTDGQGTFTASMLIFHRDELGLRILQATEGADSATDDLLVVPGTLEPSGFNVRG